MTTPTMDITTLERVELGHTGLRVSRLSFGTGTAGWNGRSDQGDLGIEPLANMLIQAYKKGINLWDTAHAYGTHPHVAAALKKVPRKEVFIVTKTLSQQAKAVKKDIERFLQELDTDYIDIVLLHALSHANWPKHYADAMEALNRAKADGKVRAVGISSHGFGALQTAAETDWCDVVMVRINHAGINMDASPEKVVPIIEQMHTAGKGVYGMKIVGNGHLTHDVRGAIEYALNLGTIHSMTLGMMNKDQLQENIKIFSNFEREYRE